VNSAVMCQCPGCASRLNVSRLYASVTFFGGIAIPPILLWALGFSLMEIVIGEILFGYPILWLICRYGWYVFRPKIVLYAPPLSFREHLARLRAESPPPKARARRSDLTELRFRGRN